MDLRNVNEMIRKIRDCAEDILEDLENDNGDVYTIESAMEIRKLCVLYFMESDGHGC